MILPDSPTFSVLNRLQGVFNSLVVRIIAVGVVLAMVTATGRFLVMTSYLRSEVTRQVATEQSLIAHAAAEHLDAQLQMRSNLLRSLGAALPPVVLDDPVALRTWLKERLALFPLFSGLWVVSGGGEKLLAGVPEAATATPRDYAGADWFQAALSRSGVVTGKPVFDSASGDTVLIMAVAVGGRSSGGRVVLAGVTPLSAPGFLDVLAKTRIYHGDTVELVLPGERVTITSDQGNWSADVTARSGLDPLLDRAIAGFRGNGTTVSIRGVEEIVEVTALRSADWLVLVRIPTAEAFAILGRARNVNLLYAGLVILVVILVLAVVITRLLQPLRTAAREIRRMADGEIELHPLPVKRRDEVGTLVAGFNYLLEQVRNRENELRDREEAMSRKAHHDTLTGLPNRAMFAQRLHEEIAFSDFVQSGFVLMFMDLDGFKPVNDGFGHAVGDEVLRQVSARLKEAAQPLDTVARLGGDEFVILSLTGAGDPRATAHHVATRCLDAIRLPFVVAGNEIRIGLSIGIAICPEHGVEPSLLMNRADLALYKAKGEGKNRYHFYSKDIISPQQYTPDYADRDRSG